MMTCDNGVVHIVEDDEHVRQSLATLLELEGYSGRVYESAEQFLAQWPGSNRVGCLLVDLRLPGMSGLELHREITQRGGYPPVILITGYGDIPTAVRALKDGILDFLEKPLDNEQVLQRVAECVVESTRKEAEEAAKEQTLERLNQLTQRERQVFNRLVEGHSNREIAEQLSISVRTAESHRAQIMEKTDCRSVSDLTRLMYRAGGG